MKIRIATRESELALFQANFVAKKIASLNKDIEVELIPMTSEGDQTDKPLHEIGGKGLFVSKLESSLEMDNADIAVHSLKDVPTALPKGIVQSAVLKRGSEKDVIIINKDLLKLNNTVATGSLRRKAQWLNKYKSDKIVDIRGNVGTRLKKLKESNWRGTIMAKAGLERLNLLPLNYIDLDWMIPAPAQGAISVQNLAKNSLITKMLNKITHSETEMCTNIERTFLKKLEGGCSAPIGAHAKVVDGCIEFCGVILSVDGKSKIEVKGVEKIENNLNIGEKFAKKIISLGGNRILDSLKNEV